MKRTAAVLSGLAFLSCAHAASAACLGRPTDDGGFNNYVYAPAEVKSFAGTKVRVHYATSGTHAVDLASSRPDDVPDTVALAAEVGDKALGKYEAMGFNGIPTDVVCASNGGDEKVDIYLVKFAGADGSAQVECNAGKCSSFVLVESTFKGRGYPTIEEGFRTVVSHELFHAVQNTYKPGDAAFWSEGTAQWAMKQVYPELVDFERQMPGFFSEPNRSIESPPAGVTSSFLYGSAVWPLFLSLRHGDDFIRTVYEVEADGTDPLTAIDTVLKSKDTSLAAEYPLFAAWNVGTGKQASTGGYPDAAKYPGQMTTKLEDGVSDITSGLGYFIYKGTLGSEQTIALATDPERNAGVVVPIVDDVLQLDRAKKLPANADGEVLVIVSGITAKKSDAKFTILIDDPEPAPAGPGSVTPATPPPESGPPPADDGGCRTTSGSSSGAGFGAGVLGVLVLLSRRRRP